MTEEKLRKISRIYGICLTVLTAIVGGLFIVQVWAIFRLGDKPFTVQNISEKFSQIALPVWLWVAAVAGGGIVFPKQKEEKPTAVFEPNKLLQRLEQRLPETDGTLQVLNKNRKIRTVLAWITVGFCAAAAAVTLVWLLGASVKLTAATEFFASHEEAERIVWALPFIAAAFALVIAVSYYCVHSLKKDAELAKTAVVINAKKGIKAANTKEKVGFFERLCEKYPVLRSKWWGIGLRIGLFALGGVLVVVGIFNGGMASVLDKAVKICTQCIGLG